MPTKTASKPLTDDKIIALYMDFVLEHDGEPKSVYKFCKVNKLEEQQFYQHFGSIDGLKKAIWSKFYTLTTDLLFKNKDFEGFSNRDKMLTFYFTFFELLNKNRSYVLFVLKQHSNKLENMDQLRGLRRNVKDFATELIDEGNANKTLKITKQNPKLFSEGAWLQLLFILRFWMNDSSPGFEDTDLAIEKSVRTIFDLFDNSVLDGIVDFGKFLYKSRMA